MLTCYADVVRRARDVGQTLPDEQRIALGLTLIRMADRPESFAAVRRAERFVGDHGRALLSEALRIERTIPEAPFTDMAIETTHGLQIDRHPGARGGAGAPRPRAFSPRVAWARLCAAEKRLSDSFAGDVIAGICFVMIVLFVVLVAGVLQ